MSSMPNCPKCQSEFVYQDGEMFICPDCSHEWNANDVQVEEGGLKVFDAFGAELKDGDAVTLIKDLKLKGSGGVLKQGTKVKSIRLVDSDHNIDCKIDGFGAMALKSEFVKKINS